jgi:hypothetical protein
MNLRLLIAGAVAALLVIGTASAVTRDPVQDAVAVRPVTGSPSFPVTTTPTPVASASQPGTCVSANASAVLLSANASRHYAAWIPSTSNTANIYFKLGATATSSNVPLVPGQGFELPTNGGATYTGEIDFIPASGTQTVCVVEF